jgi:molybdopterin-synthase adenylyltransferase
VDLVLQVNKMKNQLNKNLIERFSRQIVLKSIGIIGQKKIIYSKVLVIGAGGLGSPVVEFLSRAGVGNIGIVDNDKVSLSNLHRQSLYNTSDIGKSKVKIVKNKIRKINYNTKVKIYNTRLNNVNFKKIINDYDYIVDGSDNFKTKFLINDFCLKYKKFLVIGAISKFDGHIFTFDFKNKKLPCLRCFFQESQISDDILNCESEGILGTIAGIAGIIQANEILKRILNIGKNLNGYILILDFLNLEFRKVKIKKRKNCFCN